MLSQIKKGNGRSHVTLRSVSEQVKKLLNFGATWENAPQWENLDSATRFAVQRRNEFERASPFKFLIGDSFLFSTLVFRSGSCSFLPPRKVFGFRLGAVCPQTPDYFLRQKVAKNNVYGGLGTR